MQNKALLTILQNLGLSENESRVYLAALSLGPATAISIARAGAINRTTVYPVVESLKQKGLVRLDVRGLKKLYVAASPEMLEQILENRKTEFQKVLPDFLSLYQLEGSESFIKYYEGVAGVKTVYESLLTDVKPHEQYMVIGQQDAWYSADRKYFQKFIERRGKLPINIRLLLKDSTLSREQKKFEKNYNEAIKLLSPKIKLNANIVIIPKKVVLHQLVAPVTAIVIENKSVVQTLQEVFEILWSAVE